MLDDAGPLVAVARVDGPAPGTFGMRRTLRLAAGSDLIEVDIAIDKARVRTKESAHVAFPLNVPDGVTRVDLGEALVQPERNQLPGSCRDFIGAHSAVDVSNAKVGVSIATLDAPLIEPGAITDERQNARGTRAWRERTVAGTTLYAYLLNNYWHTNYKAYQEGPLTYRFALRPHGAFDPVALRRFSDEQDQPGAPAVHVCRRPGHAVVAPRVGRRDGDRGAPLQSVGEDGDGHRPPGNGRRACLDRLAGQAPGRLRRAHRPAGLCHAHRQGGEVGGSGASTLPTRAPMSLMACSRSAPDRSSSRRSSAARTTSR
jgi:hypothetical protein